MKKITVVLALVLGSGLLNAQWKTDRYVDEFGEKTGASYNKQSVVGVFSNSATTNSECSYVLMDNLGEEPSLEIRIFPYSRPTMERWISSKYATCKIKDPNGNIHTLKTFAFKKGIFFFQKKEYSKFKELTRIKGTYVFVCSLESTYSESSYRFSFEM